MGLRSALIGAAAGALALTSAPAAAYQTDVEPFYVDPPGAPGNQPYEITPLLSVKDMLPRTGHRGQRVQMVTIPDGLGALPAWRDRTHGRGDHAGRDRGFVARGSDFALFMNHEHNKEEDQELVLGRREYQGAIISLWQMERHHGDVQVRSGDIAYDVVRDTAAGRTHRPARAGDLDDAFARFCSGFLAWDYRKYGFDRPIYFTGEESSGESYTSSYDERGGVAVALFENDGRRELHTIPGLGHFAKENVIPVAGYPGYTVLIGNEDGPADANGGYDSQLYMYVGRQHRGSDNVMRRNGLVGGRLYALALPDTSDGSERTFERGARQGRWVKVPADAAASDPTLEEYVQNHDAFDFYRVEDGDSGYRQVVFDTTGGDETASFEDTLQDDQPGNYYGRIYGLDLNRSWPAGSARLRLEYDADEAVAENRWPDLQGGNALVSPDNMTLSPHGYLMVQEDATGYGDQFLVEQGRDAQVWRFRLARGDRGRHDDDAGRRHHGWRRSTSTDVRPGTGMPVAESECIYDGGRDSECGGNGTWESSGIIDTDHVLRSGTFLFDVQAHDEQPPYPQEPDYGVPEEDGQLLLLTPRHHDHD